MLSSRARGWSRARPDLAGLGHNPIVWRCRQTLSPNFKTALSKSRKSCGPAIAGQISVKLARIFAVIAGTGTIAFALPAETIFAFSGRYLNSLMFYFPSADLLARLFGGLPR